jgi:hypothetical protein
MVFWFVKTRHLFSIINLLFFSVVLPFCLYLAGWSSFCENCSSITYYVLSVFELLVIGFSFLFEKFSGSGKPFHFEIRNWKLKKITIRWAYVMLIGVLLLAAIENLYVSKTLFPFFHGIDTHTSVMPFVGPFLRAFSPLAYIFAFLEVEQSKKKWIIPVALLTISYQILSSGSRFSFLMEVLVAAFFILFYKRGDQKRANWKSLLWVGAVLVTLVLVVFISGELRIGASINYSYLIQYKGPLSGTRFGEVLAWYYGYFPMSFRNLNKSLSAVFDSNLYTSGKLFFSPFYDFLKLHYFMPFSTSSVQASVRVISLTAATVPTAFLYFFADFGFLFFLTPAFYFTAYWITKRSHHFIALVFASYMVVVFTFLSFMDVFQNGLPLYCTFLSAVCWVFFIRHDTAIENPMPLAPRRIEVDIIKI